MSENIYKIWCNTYFKPSQTVEKELLLKGVGKHEIVLFEPQDNGKEGESKRVLEQSDIIFGTPYANTLFGCQSLRWFQVNSAGYGAYEREDLRKVLNERGTITTNSSVVFDEPCAQHLLAMILSFVRGLPIAHDAQRTNQNWLMHELRPQIKLPAGQTVLILGFGAIGRHLAKLLAPLRMNVIGVKRKVTGNEPIKVIEQTKVDEFLPQADHVVNILPDNDSTQNFFNAERLAKLKRGSFFYNIGRGSTIDQEVLIENLKNGNLGGAYLDVTDPEPLPPEHPLWFAPNCLITPHVAGGHSKEKEVQINHFLENLRRFENGETLVNRIL